jgi:hypothetical protein
MISSTQHKEWTPMCPVEPWSERHGYWGHMPLQPESQSLAAKEVPVCTRRLSSYFLSSMRLTETLYSDDQGFVKCYATPWPLHVLSSS